jgi:cobalt-zinc-cadmium efflux system membrane fusion protein
MHENGQKSDQKLASPHDEAAVQPQAASPPSHTPAAIPPQTWGSRLASIFMMLLIVALVLGGMVVSGVLPMEWLLGHSQAGTTPQAERLKVDLVPDRPQTLHVPLDVRKSLGMLKRNKEQVAEAKRPERGIDLVLPGSTALDPTRLLRIRARFAPAEVVKIGEIEEAPDRRVKGESVFRELRSGDKVTKGAVLGVFYSVDVGSKKNDLYDGLVQLKLDEEILDRAEKARGTVPEIFILNAKRSVLGDRNAITRAENTLRAWGIPQEDIDAIHKEAEQADLDAARSTREKEPAKTSKAKEKESRDKAKQEQLDRWARVELKAPFDATIVERNVAQHEIVVDGTTNLFVLAQVDRIAVIANAPEDDLPLLQRLNFQQRHWSIRTVGTPTDKGLEGPIDEIGYLIDPNQHTAVVKGYIDNIRDKDGSWRLRGGQFASLTVTLPPPENVVEIPMNAVVDDGKQCVVFVQPDAAHPEHVVLRRVVVTHRFDDTAFVRSVLTAEDRKLAQGDKEQGIRTPEPLRAKERVITAGVLELKKELEDREAETTR